MQDRRIHGRPALPIVGSVFLLIGFIGLVTAAILAFVELHSGRNASADGIIVGFAYGPVVQFTTQRGETIQFGSSIRSSGWHAGDHVPVAYDPATPDGAQIDGFAGRWFLPGLFGILAGVFVIVGAGLVLVGRILARTGL